MLNAEIWKKNSLKGKEQNRKTIESNLREKYIKLRYFLSKYVIFVVLTHHKIAMANNDKSPQDIICVLQDKVKSFTLNSDFFLLTKFIFARCFSSLLMKKHENLLIAHKLQMKWAKTNLLFFFQWTHWVSIVL